MAHCKTSSDLYALVVESSLGRPHPYFLRSCEFAGFSEQLDFRWVKNNVTKASITFAISDQTEAISLPQSPFGGFSCASSLSSASLEAFMVAVLDELRRRRVTKIKVIQPPKPYEANSELINYLLFKNGFEQDSVLSHHFFVGRKKIKKLVEKDRSKHLVRIQEAKIQCRVGPIQDFGFLQEISSWNQERGYQVRLDEKRLISQISDYPDRYFLVSLSKDGAAIAHTLAVKLLPDAFYYFLAAIRPGTHVKNVGELCLFQLFQLAADQNSRFIDLGSSNTDAGANHSLMLFKSRLSNDICNKISWSRTL